MCHYTLFSFNAPPCSSFGPFTASCLSSPSCSLLFSFFCGCLYVCVGWAHECVSAHMCEDWNRMSVAPCLPHSLSILLPWDRVFWWTRSSLVWAGQPASSWCLYTPCPNPRMEIQAGVAIHLGLFCGHWRFKLWSSCWQIQLTNWIVSSVPTSCFLIGCAALPDIFPLLSGSPPPLFSTKRWWNFPTKRPSHGLCQHAASWISKEYSPAPVSPPGSQHSHPSELLNRSKFKISQKSEIEYLHTAHMHLHVLLAYLIRLRQGLTL